MTRDGLLRGGAQGPAIVAGDSAASLLFMKVTHADEPDMPFKREKLSGAQIAILATWIDAGPVYDEPLSTKAATIWSLKPLTKPTPPEPQNKSWVKTPIDPFILAKLEEKGMRPSAPADKRTLLRRVTLNLTGLAPTADEATDFLADESPTAFGKMCRSARGASVAITTAVPSSTVSRARASSRASRAARAMNGPRKRWTAKLMATTSTPPSSTYLASTISVLRSETTAATVA